MRDCAYADADPKMGNTLECARPGIPGIDIKRPCLMLICMVAGSYAANAPHIDDDWVLEVLDVATELQKALALEDAVAAKAEEICRKISQKEYIRAKPARAMAAACIHAGCRTMGAHRSLGEIARAAGVRRRDAAYSFNLLLRADRARRPNTDASRNPDDAAHPGTTEGIPARPVNAQEDISHMARSLDADAQDDMISHPRVERAVKTRYIFVTGGVMSGLGKGIVSSSIAKLLQLTDHRVSCIKIDPYLNYDAGTMNPVVHGEVFVTEDGGECDMDIGNYERFLNQNIPKSHNITTAQIYSSVIEKERRGRYLGACVQIIPHITDEIKGKIRGIATAESLDVLVVECGGTVGDMESLPFLEALRQIRVEEGPENVIFVHVTLAPSLDVVGEQKTKPTQHSVQELRRIGIQPDILAVRCREKLEERTKKKIAMFTNLSPREVLSCHDVESVFSIPRILHEQKILDIIFKKFGKVGLLSTSSNWDRWNSIVESMTEHPETLKIAMVGKYVVLADSYFSVNQALRHAGDVIRRNVAIDWIDSDTLIDPGRLSGYHGILVPGGFGTRGSEGIINAVRLARNRDIPFLGICFGFQLAAVEFARNRLGLDGANSTEIDPNAAHPVIDLLPDNDSADNLGGSLRLGSNGILITRDSLAQGIYGSSRISRRHRHRYELNTKYLKDFEGSGMRFTGSSDGGRRMEILEIPGRRFFLGVQFHPEFSSRPGYPEESFAAFLRAASQTLIP